MQNSVTLKKLNLLNECKNKIRKFKPLAGQMNIYNMAMSVFGIQEIKLHEYQKSFNLQK